MHNTKAKVLLASLRSAIANVVLVVLVTIWAELYAPLKTWLASIFGHHWTTKSVFSVAIFALLTLAFFSMLKSGESVETKLRPAMHKLIVATVLGIVALALFYTGHHFHLF